MARGILHRFRMMKAAGILRNCFLDGYYLAVRGKLGGEQINLVFRYGQVTASSPFPPCPHSSRPVRRPRASPGPPHLSSRPRPFRVGRLRQRKEDEGVTTLCNEDVSVTESRVYRSGRTRSHIYGILRNPWPVTPGHPVTDQRNQ